MSQLIHCLVVACLVCGATAHADPPKPRPGTAEAVRQAKSRFKQGRAFLDQKLYDEAIAEFQAAFELSPLPELLFNIAQALRLKGDNDKALETYTGFLDLQPDGPVADEARTHVAYLTKDKQARLEAARIKQEEADRQRREAEARAAAAAAAEVERQRQEAERKVREEEERKRAAAEALRKAEEARVEAERQRVLAIEQAKLTAWTKKRHALAKRRKQGYIAGGIGAGCAGIATAFGVLGNGVNSSIQSGGYQSAGDIRSDVARGKVFNALGYTFAGLGVIGLGIGVPLVVLHRDIGEFRVSATADGNVKGLVLSGAL